VTELGNPGRDRRPNARAAHVQRQKAGRREGDIANRLGIDPEAMLPREEAVLGVDRREIDPGPRALPVRAREDDLADESLAAPLESEELGCEPVEKLGMAGAFPSHAEVILRRDEAATEE